MARETQWASLPEDDYLLLVGQAAYMVSGLEGFVVNDVPQLEAHLPPGLDVDRLSSMTARQIAGKLTESVNQIANADIREYIATAGRLLGEAYSRRNDLLHARPATLEEGQRLHRRKKVAAPEPHVLAFGIDTAWLHAFIDFLDDANRQLHAIRPLHLHGTTPNGK